MNKNNFQEKITVIEGFVFIFLSLLLVMAWFLFSDFMDQFPLAIKPILIGSETQKLANGNYVINYIYKNTWTLYILQALSVTIFFLPIFTTLTSMWRYVLSSKLKIKKFLESSLFLVWLEVSFFLLSIIYYFLALEPSNLEVWRGISLMYMITSALLIIVLSALAFTAILLKQKFGKGALNEQRTR